MRLWAQQTQPLQTTLKQTRTALRRHSSLYFVSQTWRGSIAVSWACWTCYICHGRRALRYYFVWSHQKRGRSRKVPRRRRMQIVFTDGAAFNSGTADFNPEFSFWNDHDWILRKAKIIRTIFRKCFVLIVGYYCQEENQVCIRGMHLVRIHIIYRNPNYLHAPGEILQRMSNEELQV